MASKGFFDLPRKVRDLIYGELLTWPESISISDSIKALRDRQAKCLVFPCLRQNTTSDLAILRCSKRAHLESTVVLYGKNKLTVGPTHLLYFHIFLREIGPENCRRLRLLRVQFPHRIPYIDNLPTGKLLVTSESLSYLSQSRQFLKSPLTSKLTANVCSRPQSRLRGALRTRIGVRI